MPGINGLEIAEEAAKLSPSPRVVICSIVTDIDFVEAAREAGVSAYVFKTRIERELKLAIKTAAQGGFFASPAVTLKVPGKPQWALSGAYLESCNCDVTCPRISLTPPKAYECTTLVGWRIDYGSYDDTNLSGLNVAAAMYSPRDSSKWKLGLYIDDRATPNQKDALGRIFTGEAGGHPEQLANEVAVLLGVRTVPIEFQSEGNHRRLQIEGIADLEIEGVHGYGGYPITITNHPLGTAPGFPAELSKSKRLSFSDYGLEWNVAEKSGFFSPFRYASW